MAGKSSQEPVSPLLRQIRELFKEASGDGLTYGSISAMTGMNRVTVQRLLACNQIQRPNRGEHLLKYETLVKALGYELVLIKKEKPNGHGSHT